MRILLEKRKLSHILESSHWNFFQFSLIFRAFKNFLSWTKYYLMEKTEKISERKKMSSVFRGNQFYTNTKSHTRKKKQRRKYWLTAKPNSKLCSNGRKKKKLYKNMAHTGCFFPLNSLSLSLDKCVFTNFSFSLSPPDP